MATPKKLITDDVTIIDRTLLQAIFGGDSSAAVDDPDFNGHFHDGGSNWGSAPPIDLTNHITGRLTLPSPELKSIKLSPMSATPLTSSLYWTLPIPSDAYTLSPQPMFLNIYWSGNAGLSPSNAAFRVDWTYIQPGQNAMPPSILNLGSGYWPANTLSTNNPTSNTFRFKVSAAPVQLYVNNAITDSGVIPLVLPSNVLGATLANFSLVGLEITTAPTTTLQQPMTQVNVFAVELLYYSATLGNNTAPTLLSTDPGLADF